MVAWFQDITPYYLLCDYTEDKHKVRVNQTNERFLAITWMLCFSNITLIL